MKSIKFHFQRRRGKRRRETGRVKRERRQTGTGEKGFSLRLSIPASFPQAAL